MVGAANEMQTRSIYVTMASATANTTTQYRTWVGRCRSWGIGANIY